MMRKHLTIPECRGMLLVIARELWRQTLDDQAAARRIRAIITHMHRRKAHKGRRTAPPTYTVKQKILNYKKTNPHLSNQEIAIALKVSSGRVSEVLHGKRR